MKYLLSILLLMLGAVSYSYGQDSIKYRVILIGDAGEMNTEQQKSLSHAANHILPGKTVVVYLGDNIYPHGMGLPSDADEAATQQILRSQYAPMRAKGAPVYFVPGNHDWDRMGPKGLAKIKREWSFLEEQGDSLVKLVPPNGCPDPIEINLNDSLVIIAYDSEWWLFGYNKKDPDADCDCNDKKEIIERLDELRYKNRNKTIILASHHPFKTYGPHGGNFTLKDHLFPLTNLNKNLYIPMPVIGSLYPLLRTTFINPEDLKHPLYKDMVRQVGAVFDSFPNVLMVAGHEHGLQLIQDKKLQVVSGAGAKHTNTKKGKHTLFADAMQGYVTADQLTNNDIRLTYYIYDADTVRQAFTYKFAYTPMRKIESALGTPIVGDSITVQVHPSYANRGRFHRWFFGEGYRKEWAAPTKLPVLRLSQISGGLTPTQTGGGFQSKSLRLKDAKGREWVIRGVEKSTDKLLPEGLRETFAKDWVDDVTSSQHPFSALVVPPIANAVQVPHSNPVIGVVAPDKNLEEFNRAFSHTVVLLEEREPLGESDNSNKAERNLYKDNDNTYDAKAFLRARMLDMLLGDWDRHEDQWRWYNQSKDKNKDYIGIPRDRDQVFHLNRGIIPTIASQEFLMPMFRGFDSKIGHIKWQIFKSKFMNMMPSSQLDRQTWTDVAQGFKTAVTDSVLEVALRRLPASSYQLRHDVLLAKLKARRDRIPSAMNEYYKFIQKIVDIRASDKNEWVQINDAENGGLRVRINKLSKSGEIENALMDKTYDADLTKEIRLYLGSGNDSLRLDNHSSNIKVRIIGGKDSKSYQIVSAKKKVQLYDQFNGSHYVGDTSRLKRHYYADTSLTGFRPVNLYNIWMPLLLVGMNQDDGFILGAGFKYTKQEGYRKLPFASRHTLLAAHSFSTDAYRLRYMGEWTETFGKADFTLETVIKAPNNTINFFGLGNESMFEKKGDFRRFYRTRFSTYQLDPAVRWRGAKTSSLSIGPSLYYYKFDADDNIGRFINNVSKIGSYDSATIGKDKLHVGLAVQYVNDNRSNPILPQWGSFVNIRLQAYRGIGDFSKSFAQLIPEVSVYKGLNAKSSIVFSDRIGGTIGLGNAAFYQSAFVGGQGNLLGYRQYRFAGKHSAYNNMEIRMKVADVANYIIAGQFGIIGFWDVGRVWQNNDNSGKWHHGTGGGIYFAPASLVALSFLMGNSKEGWYPYFTMGLRF